MNGLDDLLDAIHNLRGACPELDQIADAFEGLATRGYTRDLRQTVIARLAGAEDDTVTVIGFLLQHLCTTGSDLDDLPDDVRKDTERHGQDAALLLSTAYLHEPASEAAALIDPMHTPITETRCNTVAETPKDLAKKLADVNRRSQNRPK